MSSGAVGDRPRLLVVGGCGGLVGRAVLREFGPSWAIRSVHRHPTEGEPAAGVERVAADAAQVEAWAPILAGVDTVLILAWYRQARTARFASLAEGLTRMVAAAPGAGVRRIVHVSVPDAPPSLESGLPYLRYKREVDRAVRASSVGHSIVRPTMLFGEGDRLLTVLVRLAARYHRLPIFGDGSYHVSPVAVEDLARILRAEAASDGAREALVGGPRRWPYRELLDRVFESVGRRPNYIRMSPRNGVRLAGLLEAVGSSLLYAYEVEWLTADLLGLPAYAGLPSPLLGVEGFLDRIGSGDRTGAA